MNSRYEYLYLCGDFNAQTGNLQDYTSNDDLIPEHMDLDAELISYLDQQEILGAKGINLVRKSSDKKINGQKLIDLCKCNNMIIANGRIPGDIPRKMTFRNTSVIDYLVSSMEGFDQVQEFKIQELDSLFSDGHTLIHFKLTTKIQEKLTTKFNKMQIEHWNEDTKQTFKNNISDNDIATIQCELNNLYRSIDNVSTRSNLDKAVDILSQIYIKSAEKTFPQKKVSFNVKTQNKPGMV